MAAGRVCDAGHWARRGRANRCALDGGSVDPRLRVRIVDAAGDDFEFCCLSCAQWWLEASRARPSRIYVTDETSGEEIEAEKAYYVRSRVVSHGPTQERRHVFRHQSDAETHAREFHGRVLEGKRRPFAGAYTFQGKP